MRNFRYCSARPYPSIFDYRWRPWPDQNATLMEVRLLARNRWEGAWPEAADMRFLTPKQPWATVKDWGATWVEDGLWNLLGSQVRGRDAIVGLWTQAMAGFPFVALFAQVAQLSTDGDQATGRVFTHENLELAAGSVSRPIGHFRAVPIRTANGWRFAGRHFSVLKEVQAPRALVHRAWSLAMAQ